MPFALAEPPHSSPFRPPFLLRAWYFQVFGNYGGSSAETRRGIGAYLSMHAEELEVRFEGLILIALRR